MSTDPSDRLAFIAQVLADRNRTGCRDWPWPSKSYPQLGVGRRPVRVSHIVLQADGRPRPEHPRNHALHSCDRAVCIAPWHLRWGTLRENTAEATERGLILRGEASPGHKVTEDDVRLIRRLRAEGTPLAALAAQFGLGESQTSAIARGIAWRHVE